jgi:hypothetical protein
MEFISLVLHFATFLLDIVDKVTHPVHLHPLHALSCEVYYESCDLCGMVLSDELAKYKLTS